jgi:hypothetical protein
MDKQQRALAPAIVIIKDQMHAADRSDAQNIGS